MMKELNDAFNRSFKATVARWEEIARGAIERNLGNVCDENNSEDSIYDEAYTLAFDALVDQRVPQEKAREIARQEAQKIAQP